MQELYPGTGDFTLECLSGEDKHPSPLSYSFCSSGQGAESSSPWPHSADPSPASGLGLTTTQTILTALFKFHIHGPYFPNMAGCPGKAGIY